MAASADSDDSCPSQSEITSSRRFAIADSVENIHKQKSNDKNHRE
jgi:hypothetical protein